MICYPFVEGILSGPDLVFNKTLERKIRGEEGKEVTESSQEIGEVV